MSICTGDGKHFANGILIWRPWVRRVVEGNTWSSAVTLLRLPRGSCSSQPYRKQTDSTHLYIYIYIIFYIYFFWKQRVNSRWKRLLSIFESSGHLSSCPSQRNASERRIFSGKQRVNSCWKNKSSIFECSLIELPFPAKCFRPANRSEDTYSRSRRSSSKPRVRENLRSTEDQRYYGSRLNEKRNISD